MHRRARAELPSLKKPDWMVGEHPGADFLNTVDARGYANEIDHLKDYADLLRWMTRAGLMSERDARPLSARAKQVPKGVLGVLAEAKALREAAHEIVMAADRGRAAPRRAVASVKDAILVAGAARSLIWTERGFTPNPIERDDLRRPLHILALQMKELFAPDNFARVHVCHGDDCDWVFLDWSPTQRRRWCHMSACGNRAKVRELRARRRAERRGK